MGSWLIVGCLEGWACCSVLAQFLTQCKVTEALKCKDCGT